MTVILVICTFDKQNQFAPEAASTVYNMDLSIKS